MCAANAAPAIDLIRLDAESDRPEFACGDDDIDEFFHKDSIAGATELMCVTYAWHENGIPVAFFSLSNDSIKKEEVPRSAFERVQKLLPREKRYSSMPAVKIGRLGVHTEHQRSGCGSRIMDYLKIWFTQGNKTGCRFLLVDAYNQKKTLDFYAKNGFKFLVSKDEKDKTRIMYFDLIQFTNRAPGEPQKHDDGSGV